jgi:hypothetical protein
MGYSKGPSYPSLVYRVVMFQALVGWFIIPWKALIVL